MKSPFSLNIGRNELHIDISKVWLLSAYSFSPYSADWWDCQLEMRDSHLVASPKWSGMMPCIVTHKQLAKDVALGAICSGDDWEWTICSEYTAAHLCSSKKLWVCFVSIVA